MKSKKTKFMVGVSLFIISLFFTLPLNAQVTIGANALPNSSAMLDIRSNDHFGLLLPNLALISTVDATVLAGNIHVPGMLVYNTATVNDVRPGIYYDNGTKWIRVGERWFYMPAFKLTLTTKGGPFEFDLYGEYKKQFTKAGNSEFVTSNASSIIDVQPTYTSGQLDYYVIAYPSDYMTITGISTAGVMTYTVQSTNLPEGSFINVILVVK